MVARIFGSWKESASARLCDGSTFGESEGRISPAPSRGARPTKNLGGTGEGRKHPVKTTQGPGFSQAPENGSEASSLKRRPGPPASTRYNTRHATLVHPPSNDIRSTTRGVRDRPRLTWGQEGLGPPRRPSRGRGFTQPCNPTPKPRVRDVVKVRHSGYGRRKRSPTHRNPSREWL